MKKFTITRTVRYTEEFEVEADSPAEAWDKSQNADFTSLNDDTILDEQIKESHQ